MTEKLFVVGVNHLKADLGCRELVSVPKEDWGPTLERLRKESGASELVLLSTCSRVEVYGVAENPVRAKDAVCTWFTARGGAPAREALYLHRRGFAARHLFRVAAGLDSWIIGETEILGQVKQAYQFAFQNGLTGRVLNRLFQSALGAGKQARAATGIQNGIHSIGGASALLAKRIFGEDPDGTVVVFGAGQAAEAVVRHLVAKNFKNVVVANRTVERARELAAKLGGTAVGFSEGLELLRTADVAIFSLSCSDPVLGAAQAGALTAARSRGLFLIDLGVPRNIDPDCANLSHCYLYDLDDLKEMVQQSLQVKAEGKHRAEALALAAAEECCGQLERVGSGAAQGVL